MRSKEKEATLRRWSGWKKQNQRRHRKKTTRQLMVSMSSRMSTMALLRKGRQRKRLSRQQSTINSRKTRRISVRGEALKRNVRHIKSSRKAAHPVASIRHGLLLRNPDGQLAYEDSQAFHREGH